MTHAMHSAPDATLLIVRPSATIWCPQNAWAYPLAAARVTAAGCTKCNWPSSGQRAHRNCSTLGRSTSGSVRMAAAGNGPWLAG